MDAATAALADFRVARYRLTLQAVDTLYLPPYKGSTFRGAFGHVFRRICCAHWGREGTVRRWPGGRAAAVPDGARVGDPAAGAVGAPPGAAERAPALDDECHRCLLKWNCPYAYIFDTAPPEGSQVLRKNTDVPRPFVLEPPLERTQIYHPGEELVFHLVLIGRGIDFLPYFIVTFRELGEVGLGRSRGRFELKEIRAVPYGVEIPGSWTGGLPSARPAFEAEGEDERQEGEGPKGRSPVRGVGEVSAGTLPLVYESGSGRVYNRPEAVAMGRQVLERAKALSQSLWQEKPNKERTKEAKAEKTNPSGEMVQEEGRSSGQRPAEARIKLDFLTMTRLTFEGHFVDKPEFHVVLRNLVRRLSALATFHHGFDLPLDFGAFFEAARGVRLVENRTLWEDWERYSSRQQTSMKFGGLVGEAVYAGPPELLAAFLPWLCLGELVHVGKNATFGLGKMAVG